MGSHADGENTFARELLPPFRPDTSRDEEASLSIRYEFNKSYEDDAESSLTAKQRHRLSSSSTISRATSQSRYTWWFEALSLAVSAVAIALTAVFLKSLDGAPIPKWAFSGNGLSLNSILSVLSTLSKSSMLIPLDGALGQLMWLSFARKGQQLDEVELYNQASRGPWGALRLLWRKDCRGVTSLGSILMVFCVALGFTQQQLISYPVHTARYDDRENLTKVSTSSKIYNDYQETMLNNTSTSGETVPVVEFAVSAAIFSSLNHYVQHDPLYRCDYGNCVYPHFTSLGVCSKCQNATYEEISHDCDEDEDYCTATYGTVRSFAWRETDGGAYYSTIINQTADATTTDSIVDTWTLDVNTTRWPPAYKAYTCKVMWCIRTINATVTNSTYSEKETNMSLTSTKNADGSAVFTYGEGAKTEFAVTEKVQIAFKSLASLLTGWSQRSRDDGKWTHSSSFFSGMATFATADMTIGLRHMHRHKALPIEVVADGMSNAIRNQMTVVGWKVERHTVVKVRQWWLLYPIVIWIMCAVFLAGVVWETRKNEDHVGAWGCSSIALLLWGVEEGVREQVADWSAKGLEVKAAGVKVQLERDGDGWIMREADL